MSGLEPGDKAPEFNLKNANSNENLVYTSLDEKQKVKAVNE